VDDPNLNEIAATRSSPAPALVTIGRLNDSDVLIDVETASVAITGDHAIGVRVLWSILAELATSPWADDIQILHVGTPPAGLAGLDRIETVATVRDAVSAVDARGKATAQALQSAGYDTAWSARLANCGDGWAPTIVVIGTDQPSEPIHGGAVVRVADHAEPGERELVVDPNGCRWKPLDLRLDLPGLPTDLLEPTEALLTTALTDEPGPEIDLRVVARYVTPPELTATEAITPATEGCVLVRVLGPVIIDGAPPINRRRVKELVVYLALHPEGVTDEQITAAL
jgi:hypothetical protein